MVDVVVVVIGGALFTLPIKLLRWCCCSGVTEVTEQLLEVAVEAPEVAWPNEKEIKKAKQDDIRKCKSFFVFTIIILADSKTTRRDRTLFPMHFSLRRVRWRNQTLGQGFLYFIFYLS